MASRIIGRLGAHGSLVTALLMQGLGIALLLGAGQSGNGIILVLVALSITFFAHAFGITAYMVTATSGLPDDQQGLATGLVTLSQQVALTLGTPILSAVAVARATSLDSESAVDAVLGGIHLAIGLDVAIQLAAAALIALFLMRRAARARVAVEPAPNPI